MLAAQLLAEDEEDEQPPTPEPESPDNPIGGGGGPLLFNAAFPTRHIDIAEIEATLAMDIEIEAVEVVEIDIEAQAIR